MFGVCVLCLYIYESLYSLLLFNNLIIYEIMMFFIQSSERKNFFFFCSVTVIFLGHSPLSLSLALFLFGTTDWSIDWFYSIGQLASQSACHLMRKLKKRKILFVTNHTQWQEIYLFIACQSFFFKFLTSFFFFEWIRNCWRILLFYFWFLMVVACHFQIRDWHDGDFVFSFHTARYFCCCCNH